MPGFFFKSPFLHKTISYKIHNTSLHKRSLMPMYNKLFPTSLVSKGSHPRQGETRDSVRQLFLHTIIFLKTSIPTCRFEKKLVIVQLLEAWTSEMSHATYTPGQNSYEHLQNTNCATWFLSDINREIIFNFLRPVPPPNNARIVGQFEWVNVESHSLIWWVLTIWPKNPEISIWSQMVRYFSRNYVRKLWSNFKGTPLFPFGTERRKCPYHLINFPVSSLSSAENNSEKSDYKW